MGAKHFMCGFSQLFNKILVKLYTVHQGREVSAVDVQIQLRFRR